MVALYQQQPQEKKILVQFPCVICGVMTPHILSFAEILPGTRKGEYCLFSICGVCVNNDEKFEFFIEKILKDFKELRQKRSEK